MTDFEAGIKGRLLARQNFSSRTYATGRTYEDYRGAFKYGYESGHPQPGVGSGKM